MSPLAFRFWLTDDGRISLSSGALLGIAVVGVYTVVVAGIAISATGSGGTCVGQYGCLFVWNHGTVAGILLAGHHLAAFLVGLLLIAVTLRLQRVAAPSRVIGLSATATLLYPIQALVGIRLALAGPTPALQYVHLTLGMGVFSLLFVGLLWVLDQPTGFEDVGRPSVTSLAATDRRRTETGRSGDTGDCPGSVPTGNRRELSVLERVRAYISLTKPRLMWLLSLVALAGMTLAVPSLTALEPLVVVATLVGGALAIGASGTFNNVIERERDRQMDRTDGRPLVRGDISPVGATVFAVLLSVTSIGVFLAFTNALAATLTLLAILFYSVGYTVLLKPNTTANITIGGVVGAFPALIGWAAVTNGVGLPAVVLGIVIVLWTPAHFYPLAIAFVDDYAEAGFPMLPVVRGERVARQRAHLYAGATMIAVAGFVSIATVGTLVTLTTTVLAAVFVGTLVSFHRSPDRTTAFRTFLASNLYLGVFLGAIVVEGVLP